MKTSHDVRRDAGQNPRDAGATRWRVLLVVAFLCSVGVAALLAADITGGYTFSSGEANITHTKLNNATAGTINSTFYSGKSSAGANPTPGNYTFIGLDSVSGLYKRDTLDVWVFDHSSLLSARTGAGAILGTDTLLLNRGGAYYQAIVTNILSQVTNLHNWLPVAVMAEQTNFMQVTGTGTWLDVTNLTVTVTPLSTLSRFYLRAALNLNVDSTSAHFRFMRNSTPIALGADAGGLRPMATKTLGDDDTHAELMEWIDAPATASAITYKLQILQSGGTTYINRGNSAADSTNNASAVSTLIVQEVRQ